MRCDTNDLLLWCRSIPTHILLSWSMLLWNTEQQLTLLWNKSTLYVEVRISDKGDHHMKYIIKHSQNIAFRKAIILSAEKLQIQYILYNNCMLHVQLRCHLYKLRFCVACTTYVLCRSSMYLHVTSSSLQMHMEP